MVFRPPSSDWRTRRLADREQQSGLDGALNERLMHCVARTVDLCRRSNLFFPSDHTLAQIARLVLFIVYYGDYLKS